MVAAFLNRVYMFSAFIHIDFSYQTYFCIINNIFFLFH